MNILHVVPFYLPATKFGGPVTIVQNLANYQDRQGHQVKIITLDLDISAEIPRNTWVEIERIPVWYQRTSAWNRCAPYVVPRLKNILHETITWSDVVHTHVALAYPSYLAIRVASTLGKPSIYTPHGNFCPSRLSQRWLPKRLYQFLYEQSALKRSTYLHASRQEQSNIESQHVAPERIAIIPNGLADKEFSTGPGRWSMRTQLGIPRDGVAMLYLGQLIEFKGLDLAIKAFGQVASKIEYAWFIVAGPDKGFERQARELAQQSGSADRIIFTGTADYELKKNLLACSDIFVLTSRTEGLPMAVLEAAAAGLPVLISPHCNIPEVATEQAGFIVNNHVEEIANGMLDLFQDSGIRTQRGTAAMQMMRKHFTIKVVCEQLEQRYLNAIEKLSSENTKQRQLR